MGVNYFERAAALPATPQSFLDEDEPGDWGYSGGSPSSGESGAPGT
jgi:hypothetical protein